VPNFSDENIDKQDRFITLIDILYDNEIKLVMSIEKSIENLSSSRKLSSKFERTLSRLNEMKSIEYWDPSI
jgi:cell division protein ZapE